MLAGTAKSNFGIADQFSDLVSELGKLNFTMVNEFPSKYFISVNHNPKKYSEFIRSGGQAKNAVLLILEPRAVYPIQYLERVQKGYSLILTPGNPANTSITNGFIPWPYENNPNPASPSRNSINLVEQIRDNIDQNLFSYANWSQRKLFLTMINANKVSPIRKENYSLRRKFAHELEPRHISVFGDLWQSSFSANLIHRAAVAVSNLKSGFVPNFYHLYGQLHWRYKTARGPIHDKGEILRSSKFSLVIENDENYVSEKIFDALIQGSIPIYRGLQGLRALIGSEIYLDLPLNSRDLIIYLESLTELEIMMYLANIQKFVSSKDFFEVWDKKIVYAKIARTISRNFGVLDA
jgi:hypothetical protein